MESKLKEQKERELLTMKTKYEQIIEELKRNAASEKEFITAEFKKKIAALE